MRDLIKKVLTSPQHASILPLILPESLLIEPILSNSHATPSPTFPALSNFSSPPTGMTGSFPSTSSLTSVGTNSLSFSNMTSPANANT